MPISGIHICQCANCQQLEEYPDKRLHQQMNLLLSRLDEQQRRWYVAVEANRMGHGGVRLLSQITGLAACRRAIRFPNFGLFFELKYGVSPII